MADDLVPDWRVQVSYKFGPGQSHMLNVRADDFTELGELLDSVPASIADKIGSASAALGLTHSVAAATGGPVQTVSVTETTTPAAGGPAKPVCAHDTRKRVTKPTWDAWFCGADRSVSKTAQCEPIFRDKPGKGNHDDPMWSIS